MLIAFDVPSLPLPRPQPRAPKPQRLFITEIIPSPSPSPKFPEIPSCYFFCFIHFVFLQFFFFLVFLFFFFFLCLAPPGKLNTRRERGHEHGLHGTGTVAQQLAATRGERPGRHTSRGGTPARIPSKAAGTAGAWRRESPWAYVDGARVSYAGRRRQFGGRGDAGGAAGGAARDGDARSGTGGGRVRRRCW